LLLGKKQRGPLLGQWNGFGGKVEKGLETITESAARELAEEAFLKAPLFPIGSIQWVVESNPESSVKEAAYRDVMIFQASDEMAPGWWDVDGLPWENMRINHKVWYPFMLADRPFRG
ncbi:MAG: hypothetical protein JOS17DRAFT_673978, partial [Linnemannia elongata]